MTNDQRKWLANFCGNDVKFNELMSEHTSLRVGGPADAYVTPESIEQLSGLISGCTERRIRYIIIGDGTNLLVKDNGIQGVVILLTKYLNNIHLTYTKKDETVIKAMAGVKMKRVCALAVKYGLEGMNMAIGIPGTVGGGVMMNAGTAIGSMENIIDAVTIMLPTGQIIRVNKEKLKFSYRKLDLTEAVGSSPRLNVGSSLRLEPTTSAVDSSPRLEPTNSAVGSSLRLEPTNCLRLEPTTSEPTNSAVGSSLRLVEPTPVILEAYLSLHPSDPVRLKKEAKEILKSRIKKQPTDFPSAGCFFKNPLCCKTAGELIDLSGLKGKRVGDAEVSKKHANFIINRGKASAADILSLAEAIRETVLKKFNILLEPEVKIVC